MPTAKGLPNTFFPTKITLNAAFAKGQMTESFHFVLIGFFFCAAECLWRFEFFSLQFSPFKQKQRISADVEAGKMFKTFSKVTG